MTVIRLNLVNKRLGYYLLVFHKKYGLKSKGFTDKPSESQNSPFFEQLKSPKIFQSLLHYIAK